MLSRNALAVIVGTVLAAGVAAAQQPAKPATTATRSTPTPTQAPGAAKKTAKTSTAAALAVTADSAKKIVASNAAGATVTSSRLHRSAGKSYYAVSYKMKGEKKTMHATVDASTGAFATVAAPAKSGAKKP
ncbi:MAG TPA: PepSY domain-containing protein [Gemmatimonadaceae bacterium]|nr:PepSY domain-containing protein [Gemmatimonadaceae bacterium]